MERKEREREKEKSNNRTEGLKKKRYIGAQYSYDFGYLYTLTR